MHARFPLAQQTAVLHRTGRAGHAGAAVTPTAPATWACRLMAAPARLNAITDVAGVEVGHSTLIRGEGGWW